MSTADLTAAFCELSDAQVNALLVQRAVAKAARVRQQSAERMAAMRDRKAGAAQTAGSYASVTPAVTQETRNFASESYANGDASVTPKQGADQPPKDERFQTSKAENAEEKEKPLRGQKKETSSPKLTDEQFLAELKADSTYRRLDIEQEAGKMRRWCETNRQQPSRRRFVNWLNTALDRAPMLPLNGHVNGSQPRAPDPAAGIDQPAFERWFKAKYPSARIPISTALTEKKYTDEYRTETC